MMRSRLVLGAILVALSASSTSLADQQSSGQQKCFNKVTGEGSKVTSSTIRNAVDCMKRGAKNSLPAGMGIQDCLTADLKDRITKSRVKLDAAADSYCVSAPPDFGYTDSIQVGDSHEGEGLALAPDCFGPNLDDAFAGPLAADAGAQCTSEALGSVSRVAAAMLKEYLACTKTGLKNGSALDSTGLEACLTSVTTDIKGSIGKATSKLQAKIESSCPQAPGALFPEIDGAGELCDRYGLPLPLDAGNLATCLRDRVRCRVCRTVNAAENLARDCDLFDDGSIDGTCPQCPNGVVDDGEQCDDGNFSNNDVCVDGCMTAICGDGFVHTGVEECDNGGANSDTAPNACRTDCTLPFCGDGITDNALGEQCDSGGVNSPDCDADCTLPSCHDGTLNLLAGEQCDDGNTSNTDGCVGSCVTATCGDGYVRSGLESCDGGDCCTLLCTYSLPGTSCTGTATTCVAPQCNASGTCLNLPTNEGGACDDGSICTPISTCQTGSCVGTYSGVGAACDWVVVGAPANETAVIGLDSSQSLGNGDWCGLYGSFAVSSSYSGDLVTTGNFGGPGMLFGDLVTVNGGDIVTKNFRIDSNAPGVNLPGLTGVSSIATGQHRAKTPAPTFYDTTGTDPRVAKCEAAQASLATTKAHLNALASTANLGAALKDLDSNGASASVNAVNVGGINVFDLTYLNGVGSNVTLTFNGGGNANTVMVLRISNRMNTGANWTFNLTNGMTANHLLIYVSNNTPSIENCALGLFNVGAGTIFCPDVQVHMNGNTTWSGAAYGGNNGAHGQVSIGVSSTLTYVPFTAALP